MLLYKNSYKGKWFVLGDESDEFFGDEGTIDSEDITDDFLKVHAENCDYYGIPMYTGVNKQLKNRCKQFLNGFTK